MLMDRPRQPGIEVGKPAEVGDGSRLGGGAVVFGGNSVGMDVVVAAGEASAGFIA